MSELPAIPSTFLSNKTGEVRPIALTVRKHLDADAARAVLGDIDSVHWGELQEEYADLIAELLPANFEEAWSAIQTGPESQEAFDEIDAFERWVYGE